MWRHFTKKNVEIINMSPLLSLKNSKIKQQWDVTKNLWEWLKIITEPVAGEHVKEKELIFIAGGKARKV